MDGIFINEVLMINSRKKLDKDCHKLVHRPS